MNRWVIISSERAARPLDAFHAIPERKEAYCPFCEGEEHATPPELFALRENGSAPNGPGWKIRVAPNKFPALGAPGDAAPAVEGFYQRMDGIGHHEVFIETPCHTSALETLDAAHIAAIYHALAGRLKAIRRNKAILCAQYFKNHGQEAGASLAHAHSQLIAMPVISRALGEELAGAGKHLRETGECVFCSILRREQEGGGRLIAMRGRVAAVAPFASRFPYEALILPVAHHCRFEDSPEGLIEPFAALLKEILAALARLFDAPPYNLVLHSAPFGPGYELSYHWHMEVIPVMARAAGFEWGSGFHINSVPPEDAAARLREAMGDGR